MDQVVNLCLAFRRKEIPLAEFRARLLVLVNHDGELQNIAIDVESAILAVIE